MMKTLICAVVLGAAGMYSGCAAAPGWKIAVLPGEWECTGFEEDKDLSAVAAWDATHVLVATDETVTIQPGVMDRAGRRITAGAALALPVGGGGKRDEKEEADCEGLAVMREEKAYFLTGSHGLGKKKADFQEGRCQVFRIPVDPATGEARGRGITSASLLPWAAKDPVLGRHVRQPLQLNGFNIEGLAAKDGKLWFGLRAPNEGGDAFVVETSPAALFEKGGEGSVLHRIPVGAGVGIREIAALRDGFLVLTGNASAEATKKQPKTMAPGDDVSFTLWFWRPGGLTQKIGELPEPTAKAEGLLVLEETADEVEVLVLFDSAPGGGPKAYRLSRPKP